MTIMGLIYLSSITGVLILLLISVINRNINTKNFLLLIIFSGLLISSAFHSLSNNVGTFGKDSSSEYYVIRKTIVNGGFREIESAFEAALSVSLTIPILLIITNMRFISFYNFIYLLFILIDIIIFYKIAKRIFSDEKISFFSTVFYIANYWILTYSLSMLRAGIAYILLHCLYLNILRSKNDQQKQILVSMLLSISIVVSYYSLVIPSILTLLLTEIVEIKQKKNLHIPILSISLIVFSFLYLMYYTIIAGQHIIDAFHNLISNYEERYHTKVSLIEPSPQAETSLKIIGQQLKLATFITNYLLALANYFLLMKKKYTLLSHRKFFYLATSSLVTFIVTSPFALIWGIINFSYFYHWVIALLTLYFIYVVRYSPIHYSIKATVKGFLKIFLLLVMLINVLNTTFVIDYLCGLSNSYILDTIWNDSLNLFTLRLSDYYSLIFLVQHYSEYTKILGDCNNIAHINYVLAEYFQLSNKIVITTTSYHALSSNPSILKGVYMYLSSFNVRTESLYLHMQGVGYGIPLNISSSLNMTDIIYNSGAQIRFGGNI